jgi:citrate lyase alpha subunit
LNLSNETNIELAYIDEGNSFLIPTGGGQTTTIQYVREDDLSRQLRWNLQFGGLTGQVIVSTKQNYSGYQAYLTIKYTKTTDTAGGGN